MGQENTDIERELGDEQLRELLRALNEELDGSADCAARKAWLDEAESRISEPDSGLLRQRCHRRY